MKEPFPRVSHEQWRARVERELGGEDFERALVTPTLEGLAIQPLYSGETPASWRTEQADGSGFPGLWPYTRGARALPRSGRSWRLCQLQQEPDLEALRQAIADEVAGGAEALWLRLDRAARLGLDGDADEAAEHVGWNGATIYSADDLQGVLAGAARAELGLRLDAGANALPAAAITLAVLPEHGGELTFGADPLGALARDGELPGPLSTLEAEMATLVAYCQKRLPDCRALAVSTLPYHEAGAHAVQELAYALATGAHYLRRLEAAGIAPQTASEQMVFDFAVGRHLFLEIAKLRAARLLWAKLERACGLEEAPAARIQATTSARTLTRRDPWNNLLRVTTQVLAAVVGGADSISSSSFDAALGRPGADGRRLARNTQLILAEEAHMGRVLDPAGGSFYVEWLTEQLARAAWSLFQQIERRGGMADCLLSGLVAEQVEESWQRRLERQRQGLEPITGVTDFAAAEEEPLERPPRRSPELTAAVARRVGENRRRRGSLEIVISERGVERVEACISAAGRGGTLGELSAALGREGEPARMPRLPFHRESEPYEDEG